MINSILTITIVTVNQRLTCYVISPCRLRPKHPNGLTSSKIYYINTWQSAERVLLPKLLLIIHNLIILKSQLTNMCTTTPLYHFCYKCQLCVFQDFSILDNGLTLKKKHHSIIFYLIEWCFPGFKRLKYIFFHVIFNYLL